MALSESTPTAKRHRADSDMVAPDSAEAKRLCQKLLDILENEDASGDAPDLASVMRSFEQEIAPRPAHPSASDDPQPPLGFLLEASDDELGLPPTADHDSLDDACGTSEAAGLGQLWGFEDDVACYDPLAALGGYSAEARSDDELVGHGGLFDFSDAGSGLFSEFPELPLRPESLPAL